MQAFNHTFTMSDYFKKPNVPDQWTLESIGKAKSISNQLRGHAVIYAILSTFGALFVSYKLAAIGFTAFLLSPTCLTIAIGTVACLIFAYYLRDLAAQHVKGLTKEQLISCTVDKLIDEFTHLEQLKKEQSLNSIIFDFNQLYSLCTDISSNGEQQKFKIYSRELKMPQIQSLLEAAYRNHIILEFDEFSHDTFLDKTTPSYSSDVERDFGKIAAEGMLKAFDISVEFLEKRLQESHMNLVDINNQLNALGYKWETQDGIKVLKNPVYLEDELNIVIQGNCNEIPNPPLDAVSRLVDYVEAITIHQVGINQAYLSNKKAWQQFKNQFLEFGEKVSFIEGKTLCADPFSEDSINNQSSCPDFIENQEEIEIDSDDLLELLD